MSAVAAEITRLLHGTQQHPVDDEFVVRAADTVQHVLQGAGSTRFLVSDAETLKEALKIPKLLPFLRFVDPEERRGLIGYVPQDPLLFSGTIRDNILFGCREGQSLPESELARLIEVSRLSDEIAAFPDGLETKLGQRGTSVSGGQKQRIAIARALAGYPALLLLDDMTASLDTNNEEALWRSLAEMPEFARAAVIAVSHRLSSIQYVDRVLFLKNGRITGFGEHSELMANNPAYREFVAEHVQRPGE
jgi:ABC-type multidrug transport system fused ATPase/permease subunit